MTRSKTKPLEVLCCECGNPIPTIPRWLINAKVQFECEECRQKQRLPGMPDRLLDTEATRAGRTESPWAAKGSISPTDHNAQDDDEDELIDLDDSEDDVLPEDE